MKLRDRDLGQARGLPLMFCAVPGSTYPCPLASTHSENKGSSKIMYLFLWLFVVDTGKHNILGYVHYVKTYIHINASNTKSFTIRLRNVIRDFS